MADNQMRPQNEGGQEEERRPGPLRWLGRGAAAAGLAAWIKLLTLGVLAVAAGALVTYGAYYQITKEPITALLARILRGPVADLPLARAMARGAPPRYLFSIYGVSRPLGVAVDPADKRIYVAESGGERRLRVFDPDGRLLGSYAPAESSGLGRNLTYVAVDAAGIIYTSDRLAGTIETFGADGTYLGIFDPLAIHASEGGRRWLPLGMDFDRQGNLYITDVAEEHQVHIIARDGTLKKTFGKSGLRPGELNWPQGVAVDFRGRLFISNGNNGRIEVFDGDGNPKAAFGRGTGVGSVGMPRGIAIDNEDRLYVADIISHQVNVYDVSGEEVGFLFSFGANGIGDGEFAGPFDVAVDSTSRLYVTDRDNNRVQVWVY